MYRLQPTQLHQAIRSSFTGLLSLFSQKLHAKNDISFSEYLHVLEADNCIQILIRIYYVLVISLHTEYI